MAMCVRSFANVSTARSWHPVSLLTSALWDGQSRIQLQPGMCGSAKRWTGPSLNTHMTIAATTTSSQETDSSAIFFAEAGISRAAEMRVDAVKLSHALNSAEALVVPLMGSQNLVKEGKPVLVTASALQLEDAVHASVGAPVFLGLSNSTQAPVFAVSVAKLCSTGGERPAWEYGGEWVDVRRYGPQLQASDAGLLAYARGMVEWQSRNMYCGRCGAQMISKEGGHSLHCSSDVCKNAAYPRLDPAVIMLITCGDYVLLGRQSRWNPGRYSLLAGFVEIGETFEMAVAREVKEESGINVDLATVSQICAEYADLCISTKASLLALLISPIIYAASQPWPFPSSLMVGFIAAAVRNPCQPYQGVSGDNNAVAIGHENFSVVDEVNALPRTVADNNELEDARWVHKDLLRWVLEGKAFPHGIEFSIPGKYAIAHILLRGWVGARSTASWAGDSVKTVEIDEGIFKYVLMCIRDNKGREKLIVRGDAKLAYHSDLFEATQKEIQDSDLQVLQLGGGRIEHNTEKRKIHVFSISQAYGPADHIVTCALLKQWFPLHNITFSQGG